MSRFVQDGTGVVISVADEKDGRYTTGWAPEGDAQKVEKSATPDKTWKVDELKQFAADNSIDLGEATKKDDILAVLAPPAN